MGRESVDRIKGCDGTWIHAVGSLAGADGWNITNVAAFPISAQSFAPSRFRIPGQWKFRDGYFFVDFSTSIVNKAVHDALACPPLLGLTALHRRQAIPVRYNCTVMGVTVELENLGDVQLCQEIVAGAEHRLPLIGESLPI